MRAAVIGAGIVGACAAHELALAGVDVTLLEQFDIDHDRGSSFGDSRIIRRFYDDPYYTRLMTAAYPLWARLQAESGATLVEKLGGLYFGPRDHPRLASALRGLQSVNAETALIDAVEMRRRYPAFRFDDAEAGLFDGEAGSLRASRCVRAAVAAAQRAGCVVRTGARVAHVERDGNALRVNLGEAGGEAQTFDRVAVCAGSWTATLLREPLPVRATRQQYVHLDPGDDRAQFQAGAFPVWIDAAADWYGFPEHGDVPGVKVASHEFGDVIDPDNVRREIDQSTVDRTRAYARRRLPALANGAMTYGKVCLYTVSRDEDFIVDAVPEMPGAFFVTGCSGHAFKFGTLLGGVVADLALGRATRVDIARFRMSRFEREPQASA